MPRSSRNEVDNLLSHNMSQNDRQLYKERFELDIKCLPFCRLSSATVLGDGIDRQGKKEKLKLFFDDREEKPLLRLWVALVRKKCGPGSVCWSWSHALGLTLRILETRLLPEL